MSGWNWSQLSEFYAGTFSLCRVEWNALPEPMLGPRSDEAVERACDEWCRELVLNPNKPPRPDEHLKPWLLARLLYARGATATLAARRTEALAWALNSTMILRFLIEDWRDRGRTFWERARALSTREQGKI